MEYENDAAFFVEIQDAELQNVNFQMPYSITSTSLTNLT
jgi:hypothetical protein